MNILDIIAIGHQNPTMCIHISNVKRMDKLTATHYRMQEIKCIICIAYYKDLNLEFKAECCLCYDDPGEGEQLRIGIFHGFMFGGTIPLNCVKCGVNLVQVRSVIECEECLWTYPKVFRMLAHRGCREENIIYLNYNILAPGIVNLETTLGAAFDID